MELCVVLVCGHGRALQAAGAQLVEEEPVHVVRARLVRQEHVAATWWSARDAGNRVNERLDQPFEPCLVS